jgi:hypothetical protein
MKNKFYIFISLFALVFISAVSIDAQTSETQKTRCRPQKTTKPKINNAKTTEVETQTDLSVRPVLYFIGARTDKFDFENDKYAKYVSDGGTMQLYKLGATSCNGDICKFNIGFIASRSGETTGELSTYGLFQVTDGSSIGNTVYFAAGEQTKQGVYPLELNVGINKVTFTIDPDKKTVESSEDNNSLSVTFDVSRLGIPGKKTLRKN